MTIKRRCNNCHELYEGRQCPKCAKKMAVKSTQRRLAEDEGRKLYSSRLWEKCRKNVRLKYGDYDVWLLGIGIKRVCEKPYVHHIIPREENPALEMNVDNLITVSKKSHEEIHKWYRTDRTAAIARIKKGIKEYQELYGQ